MQNESRSTALHVEEMQIATTHHGFWVGWLWEASEAREGINVIRPSAQCTKAEQD